jgi:hypothetical protein
MPAGSTYTPIATTTLGSSAASYTFSSIPSTYTDLILIGFIKDVRNANGTDITIRVNGDTASNYSWTFMQGSGSTATSSRGSSQTIMWAGIGTGVNYAPSIYHFNNYANTNTYKTLIARNDEANSATRAGIGMWRSTSAINSITVIGEQGLNTGTTLTLYGIASA